jgi:intracellular multiplication protein IcmV
VVHLARVNMGIISGVRRAGSSIFNFKVTRWFGKDFIFDSLRTVANLFLGIFTPEQAEVQETYEQALIRLGLSESDIQQRQQEFTKLFIFYLTISAMLFAYSLFIVVTYHNIGGFFMGFSITLYALTQAFRYHFWLFQIRNKKLGCSFREWLMDK